MCAVMVMLALVHTILNLHVAQSLRVLTFGFSLFIQFCWWPLWVSEAFSFLVVYAKHFLDMLRKCYTASKLYRAA